MILCIFSKILSNAKCLYSDIDWHVSVGANASFRILGRSRDTLRLNIPDLLSVFADGAIGAEFA